MSFVTFTSRKQSDPVKIDPKRVVGLTVWDYATVIKEGIFDDLFEWHVGTEIHTDAGHSFQVTEKIGAVEKTLKSNGAIKLRKTSK